MNFWPFVNEITVSGVMSMCSIRSEFRNNGTRLSRVTLIIGLILQLSLYRRKLGKVEVVMAKSAVPELWIGELKKYRHNVDGCVGRKMPREKSIRRQPAMIIYDQS